jgi:hypothetical protein
MQIGHLFPLFIRLKKDSHKQIRKKKVAKSTNVAIYNSKKHSGTIQNSSKKTNRLEYKINIKYKTKLSCTKVLNIRGHKRTIHCPHAAAALDIATSFS